MKSSVAIIFFRPTSSDLLVSLKNISKFENALVVWNSNPINLKALAKEKEIDLTKTNLYSLINKKNLGIGGGLNTAFKFANKIGLKYILALDQDSLVIMNKQKLNKYFDYFDSIKNFGCIGFSRIKGKYDANINNKRTEYKLFNCNLSNLVHHTKGDLLEYSYMHSGTVYDIRNFIKLKGFKQEYFMEFTDIEYSLRVKKNKMNLLFIKDSLILHDAGFTNSDQSSRFSTLYHPIWISYLQYRNLLILLSQYLLSFPLWSLKSIIIFSTIMPLKICINNKSFVSLFLIISTAILDGFSSILSKRIITQFYELILEKKSKFKIPIINTFKI